MSANRPVNIARSKNPVIQRLVLAMGNDQAHAASVLALSRKSWISSAEDYALFDDASNLANNTDTNITLWGHADQYEYGDRTVGQLVAALISKHLDDSKHTVLELIGCAPNQTGDKSTETYAQLLQATLDDDQRIKRKITVKAFPMPAPSGDSTNYRFDAIDKFIYFYGDKEKYDAAEVRIKQMLKVHIQGIDSQKEQGLVYKNFIEYLKTVKELKFVTGDYKDMRKHLETTHVIKTHKKQGLLSSLKSEENELFLQDVYGT